MYKIVVRICITILILKDFDRSWIKNPAGQDYDSQRESFINSRMGQIKSGSQDLFYKEGKYEGLPSKQHVILIMHGYSPDPKKIKSQDVLSRLSKI